MKFKIAALLALIVANISAYAGVMFSGPISNQTSKTISFSIGSRCSTDIGNIPPFSTKQITIQNDGNYCDFGGCSFMIYDDKDCSGNKIGMVSHAIIGTSSVTAYDFNLHFSTSAPDFMLSISEPNSRR